MSQMLKKNLQDQHIHVETDRSFSQCSLTVVLFVCLVTLSACGLIMDDPYPYPDMGGAEEEAEISDAPNSNEE